MLRSTIRPKARYDLAYYGAYIKLDNPGKGAAFRAAVEKEVELLREHPFLGRRRFFRNAGLRSWAVRGFEKYLIFYRPTDTTLEIVRVLHGAMDLERIFGRA